MEHPHLRALLAGSAPLAVTQTRWGTFDLTITAYGGMLPLPDELVSSVRCLVTCGEQVLVCADSGQAAGVLPGGRREANESWQQTAVREVHEETGWVVDASTLTSLGFLHFRHTNDVPVDHPYPHPDFLQVVLAGDGTPGSEDWVDTDDGYVTRSWAVPASACDTLPLGPMDRLFLQLRTAGGSRRT